MKTIARLPLARLDADESHVEAFKALGHLTRLQVFFFLVRAGKKSGHVFKRQDGNVESVAEAHEAGRLHAGGDVQHPGQHGQDQGGLTGSRGAADAQDPASAAAPCRTEVTPTASDVPTQTRRRSFAAHVAEIA